MRELNLSEYANISGGLTDKQEEVLMGKAGGYAMSACFLGIVYLAGGISFPTFLITGIGVSIAKLVGSYLVYENKETIVNYVGGVSTYIR